MALIKDQILRALSRALGTPVSIDAFDVSLLGGSIDARGVVVEGSMPATPPLARVARVVARVALGRALAKEIAIRALTIERPVVRIMRAADGTLNLPRRSREDASGGAAGAGEPGPAREADESAPAGGWTFAIAKLLIVDGEVQVDAQDATGQIHRLAAGPIMANLVRREGGGGYDLTLVIDRVGRTDHGGGASLGPVKVAARLDGVDDLARIAQAALDAQVEVGPDIRATVRSERLADQAVQFDAKGTLDLPALLPLLPPNVARRLPPIGGRLRFSASGTHAPDTGLRVDRAELASEQLTVGQTPRD